MKSGGIDKYKRSLMQINISLPNTINFEGTKGVESYLKQMELAIHHAQKSLKELVLMQKENGDDDPNFECLLRIASAEDSDTGEIYKIGERAYTQFAEIEIYSS